MELIDIGANLTHDSFDADRDAVIATARDAGVVQMVVTGADREHSVSAAELAAAHPGQLYATAGVHPHHAKDFDAETLSTLDALADRDEVVSLGEAGLDYFRNFSSHAEQEAAFTAQLELAVAKQLPMFMHQRDAHADFLRLLKPQVSRLKAGIVHCFTDTAEALADYLDLGLSIGITGWVCDERRGRDLLALVPDIPLERLMIETDAPYLLPRSLKPRPKTRRNEPKWLPEVAATVARAKGMEVEELAAATTANARAFFGFSAP